MQKIWPLIHAFVLITLFAVLAELEYASSVLSGGVTDPQGKAVARATVQVFLPNGALVAETRTDDFGQFSFGNFGAGQYRIGVSAPGFSALIKDATVLDEQTTRAELQFTGLQAHSQSVIITAKTIEPMIDLRNRGSIRSNAVYARRSGLSAVECTYLESCHILRAALE